MAAYIERALAKRESGEQYPFVTWSVESGRIVGSTRFYDLTPWDWTDLFPGSESLQRRDRPDVASIGYTWLEPSAQRSPVNTEAKLLMMSHAFEQWGPGRSGSRPTPATSGRAGPSSAWAAPWTGSSGPTGPPPTAGCGTPPSSPCWTGSGPSIGPGWRTGSAGRRVGDTPQALRPTGRYLPPGGRGGPPRAGLPRRHRSGSISACSRRSGYRVPWLLSPRCRRRSSSDGARAERPASARSPRWSWPRRPPAPP